MKKRKIIFIVAVVLLFGYWPYVQKADSQWFEDARYGMFIHWGLYSAAESIWHGGSLRYLNDYAEWIQYRNRIAKEDYSTLTLSSVIPGNPYESSARPVQGNRSDDGHPSLIPLRTLRRSEG